MAMMAGNHGPQADDQTSQAGQNGQIRGPSIDQQICATTGTPGASTKAAVRPGFRGQTGLGPL